MGMDGIMYAGPVADASAGLAALVMVGQELRRKEYQEMQKKVVSGD